MTAQKSALVFGATGLIGGHLLQELLNSPVYGDVRAVVRREIANSHPKLRQLVSDYQSINELKADLAADDIFCCLGTTREKTPNLQDYYRIDHDYPVMAARLAKACGGQTFLLVSAVGADAGSSNFYLRMKGETERDVSTVGFKKLHIFRPSLLTGRRQETRWLERLSEGLLAVINPLLIGRWKRYRSIPAATVACAMYRAAQRDITGIHIHYADEMRNRT